MIKSCFKIGEMLLEMLYSSVFMCEHADGSLCDVKASAVYATYCCIQQWLQNVKYLQPALVKLLLQ